MIKILAIDDNNDNVNNLKVILKIAFPESIILSASNGKEGIELAVIQNPDVILLGILMPDMDGFEVCQQLKKDKRVHDIPVVFFIAIKNDKENRKKALCVGAEGFLSMPIDESDLIAQIRVMSIVREARFQKQLEENIDNSEGIGASIYSSHSKELSIESVMYEQKLLRTLIDNLPYAIYVKDLEARKLISNDADILIMHSNSEADFLGKTDLEIFGSETGRSGYNEDLLVIQSGKPMLNKENHYVNIDGETHWRLISKYPLFDQNGKISGLLGIGHDITNSKKADEALNESQALYHSFVEHLPAGVFRKNDEGRYIFVNTRFCELKGLTVEEILGKTPDELKNYELSIDSIRKSENMGIQRTLAVQGVDHHKFILQEGKSIELEEVYPQPDGSIRYFNVVKTPVFSSTGKVIGSQGIQLDITNRKLAEEALKDSYDLNTSLLQTIPFGMNIVDEQGNILFLSENLEGLFGKETIGKKCWGFYRDNQTQCKECPLIKGIEIGKTSILETDSVFGGKTFQISYTGMIFKGKKAMLEIFQDITERKKTNEILLESLARFRSSFDQSPVGSLIVGLDQRIVKSNSAFCNFIGYSEDELIGARVSDITYPDDLEVGMNEMRQLMESEIELAVFQKRYIRKDRNTVWGGITLSIVRDAHNKPLYYLPIIQDIDNRKQIELELITAKNKAEESDQLKSAFLANMSHEIRTPLNCILGFSELLSDPDTDKNQSIEYSHLIEDSGNNLLAIINNILDISKIEAGQVVLNKKSFTIQKLIHSVKKEFDLRASEKGIQLIIDSYMPQKEIQIVSDEAKIKQVLINFIGNAIKFTEKGYIVIGMKASETTAKFYVSDSGIGIPAEFHSYLFDRFRQVETAHTRKYGGNGLGLSISKSLIELLGGKIGVESEEGKGSTFYFLIPKN